MEENTGLKNSSEEDPKDGTEKDWEARRRLPTRRAERRRKRRRRRPSSGVRLKYFIQRGFDCGDGAAQRDCLLHELTCKEALEAAASLQIGAHSCDTYLRRLTEKRTLRRVSEGKYRLADAAKTLKDE